MVATDLGEPCERLPIPIMPCTVCGHAIPQTRGWSWVNTKHLLEGARSCGKKSSHCGRCPVCDPRWFEDENVCTPPGKAGLLWIGEQFYPTPEDWSKEGAQLGISRRISAIPRGFVVGKSWVFVAHPKAFWKPAVTTSKQAEPWTASPGVFHVWKPQRVELIVTPSMRSEPWVIDLANKGVTLVEVPEDDPDHLPVKKSGKSRRRMAADRVAITPAPKVKDPEQSRLF